MSKQITSTELATIVSTLLTNPQSLGQLEESTAFAGFMTDVTKSVTDYCGGEVREPASPLDDVWYIGIHWNDSVPSDDGVWAAYDKEADFNPEHPFSDEPSDTANHYSTQILEILRDRYGWDKGSAQDGTGALLHVQQVVGDRRFTVGFTADPIRRRYIAVWKDGHFLRDKDCRGQEPEDVARLMAGFTR